MSFYVKAITKKDKRSYSNIKKYNFCFMHFILFKPIVISINLSILYKK